MKPKVKQVHPAVEWKKGETRPCPSGRCKHSHIRGTGPCTATGCGCHGAYGKQKKGGR